MSESALAGYSDEPAAKRMRNDDEGEMARNNNVEMDTNEPTILEWLNGDVLRIVLNYISIEDILRSITVSKKWRNGILEYLKGSHYCFEHYYLPRLHFVPRLLGLVSTNDEPKRRSTPFDMSHGDYQKFRTKIKDLGPGIVTIILDCLNENSLRIITQNCPNLKELMLVGIQDHAAHEPQSSPQCPKLTFTEEVRQCLRDMQLKRVFFVDCKSVPEELLAEFVKNDSIEELVVSRDLSLDGDFLSRLSQRKEKNLKTLRLVACGVEFLDSEAEFLTELTVLDLSNNFLMLMENVHKVLDKTSKLEYLYLNSYPKTDMDEKFVQSLGQLGCLKHLSLCWNDNVCDEWLAAVAQGCPGLRTLDIETKTSGIRSVGRATVSAGGLLALCRAARALAHLGVAGNPDVTDAAVAEMVAACPSLESIDLRGCARVAENMSVLTGLAARRRGRPLRLRLARTALNRYQAQAPQGLIFDFVDAPRLFRLV